MPKEFIVEDPQENVDLCVGWQRGAGVVQVAITGRDVMKSLTLGSNAVDKFLRILKRARDAAFASAQYDEVWYCEPPEYGRRYRVVREYWETDIEPPVRHVHQIELA